MIAASHGPNEELQTFETYTLHVSYPQSKEHSQDDQLSASLTLEANDSQLVKLDAQSTFKAGMTKLLRTLCINTQTLDPLPSSLKVHYFRFKVNQRPLDIL